MRMDRSLTSIVIMAGLVFIGAACQRSNDSSAATDRVDGRFTAEQVQRIGTLSPLPEVPDAPTNAVADDEQAARMGQFLFYDERLSANNEVSCASCHDPSHGFSSPRRLGHGIGTTPRHPPSVLNAAYHRWFDWDGKADSLWLQAARPLENPSEHGISRTTVVRHVYEHPELKRAYQSIFEPLPGALSDDERFPKKARPIPNAPDHPAHRAWQQMREGDRETVNRIFANVLKTIAAYERKLTAGEAPFDRYVEGLEAGDDEKLRAISPSAKRGLKLFIGKAGCMRCHNGPLFSDKTFHNLGLGERPWLKDRDPGRYRGVERVRQSPFNATGPYSDAPDGREADRIEFLKRGSEDRGQFKTPSLRNVELTAPYMHGGHFETLEEVVRFYSTLNEVPEVGHREEMLEPLGLTDREIDDLVSFMKSLTGELPDSELLRQPDSPLSDEE